MTDVIQDGLARSPLQGYVDPNHFHPSPSHAEALARLHYLVEQHLRIGALLGPAGSGKSMLLARLAGELASADRRVLHASLLGLDPRELLAELAAQLQLNPRPGTSTMELWRAVTDRLKEHKYQRIATAVLLDDADEAPPETLAAVCRLAEMDATEEARLTIILAVQANGAARLPRRLLERAALRVDVEPWEREDTLEFLTQAVEQLRALDSAGDAPREAFTDEAIDKLHELSGGLPRRVSQLAQWSLLAGAGLGLEQVDDETVASAAEQLGVAI